MIITLEITHHNYPTDTPFYLLFLATNSPPNYGDGGKVTICDSVFFSIVETKIFIVCVLFVLKRKSSSVCFVYLIKNKKFCFSFF